MKKKTAISIDNSLAEIEAQFPEPPPSQQMGEPVEYYPENVEMEFDVIVCDNKKYLLLEDAARYFSQLKKRRPWKQDSPIFRTARYWCMRVWPKIGVKQ